MASEVGRERVSFVLSDVQRRRDQELDGGTPARHASAAQEPVEVAAALEYRDALAQRGHHPHHHLSHHPHHHHPHHHHPAYAPSFEPPTPPPPSLPKRRGPSCVCSLACLALLGCATFLGLVGAELAYIKLEAGGAGAADALEHRREHARQMMQQAHATAPDVELGLWDERLAITPMQLAVVLSLALGIDEASVVVVDNGAHFFGITLSHQGEWVIDAIKGDFIDVLNAQATMFGAKLVISHEPTLVVASPAASVGTIAHNASARRLSR